MFGFSLGDGAIQGSTTSAFTRFFFLIFNFNFGVFCYFCLGGGATGIDHFLTCILMHFFFNHFVWLMVLQGSTTSFFFLNDVFCQIYLGDVATGIDRFCIHASVFFHLLSLIFWCVLSFFVWVTVLQGSTTSAFTRGGAGLSTASRRTWRSRSTTPSPPGPLSATTATLLPRPSGELFCFAFF